MQHPADTHTEHVPCNARAAEQIGTTDAPRDQVSDVGGASKGSKEPIGADDDGTRQRAAVATCSDQIYARMELIKSMKQALVKQTADALKQMNQPASANEPGQGGAKGAHKERRAAAAEPAVQEEAHGRHMHP